MNSLLVVFGFVLVLVFCFVLPIVIYSIHMDHKKKAAELAAEFDGNRAETLEFELAKVNERLAVLERIVTDGRYDLEQEIRRLDSA